MTGAVATALLAGCVPALLIASRWSGSLVQGLFVGFGAGVVAYATLGVWSAWYIGVWTAAIVASALPVVSRASTAGWWIVAHLAVTAFAVVSAVPLASLLEGESWNATVLRTAAIATGLVAAVGLGAEFVNVAVQPFAEEMRGGRAEIEKGIVQNPLPKGLRSAGRVIGLYERLLIFLFVLVDAPTAIGLLVAAKSVLRFGDLRDSRSRKDAEYVLIGTLISFSFALVVAYATRQWTALLPVS